MVRGVAEPAIGVGAEKLSIGAGDSEEGFPVIESPSKKPIIVICKMIFNCLAFSRERLRSVLSNVLLSTSFSRNHFRDTVILNVGGMIHQVKWETIEKFPKSRLHNLRFAVTEGNREK